MARNRKLAKWLKPHEVAALKDVPNVRCPTGIRNRAILEVMHLMGLRNSEVCKLRRTDIDWKDASLMVRGGKGAKDRPLGIPDAVMPRLEAWDAERYRLKVRAAERFFCTLQGAPLDGRYLRQLVKRLARKAGLEDWESVHPHTLRHTFGRESVRRGTHVVELQTMLGHENLATTQLYAEADPEDLIAKMHQIADLPADGG